MALSRRTLALRVAASLGALLVSGCSQLAPAERLAPTKPKLMVLLVVDGLPMRQITQVRDQLAPDGFARFLDRGQWFSDAHYGHGHTVTAAGHAVMLTGAHPQRTGIISNEWRDLNTGEQVYCTQDPAHTYIDSPTPKLAGTSPRNLKAETLGDVLRGIDPEAKVIGISGKDRGAILPAGHKGTAYMYMSETGRFASSTYYMAQHPAWVTAFNAAKPADAFFNKAWAPLLTEAAYARSVPDGQTWQVASGNGNRLPAVIGDRMDAPGPRFYGNLMASPFGDELTLAFARAAIEAERLGQRGRTDILSVSLSSHDYVNHAMGPESRLSHDHLLHLDRHLQHFFEYLDRTIGRDAYVMALTADHGFADTPEWAQSQGRQAGRLAAGPALASVNAALQQRFGVPKLARDFSASGLLLDDASIASRGLPRADVERLAKEELLKLPGVLAVFDEQQMRGGDADNSPYLGSMRKSWDPERAPSLQYVMQAGWFLSSRPGGTTHGSPHAYDSHVPLLFWGRGVSAVGARPERVEIADLAPTLAGLLALPAPAQAQGRNLQLR